MTFLFHVPLRFDVAGNEPTEQWTGDKVMAEWKRKDCYEIVFRDNAEEVLVFGDIDRKTDPAMTAEAFQELDSEYRKALERFLDGRPYALATASDHAFNKISWRYYRLDIKGCLSAQKAFAERVNELELIKLSTGEVVCVDVGVYTPNRKMRMLYARKQTKTISGLEKDRSKWEKRPLVLVHGAEADTIIHNVRHAESLPVPPKPPARAPICTPLPHKDFEEVRTLVLDVLPTSEADDRTRWRNILWAIKGTENSARGRELAHEFSRRSAKYDAKAVDRMWNEGSGAITAGTIHYRARASNPVAYAQTTSKVSVDFLDAELKNGDIGKAKIFAEHFRDVLVAVPTATKRTYYLFKDSTGLWSEVADDAVITLFTSEMKHILKPLAVKMTADHTQCADSSEGKEQRKNISALLMIIEMTTKTKSARDCLPQIHTCLLADAQWATKTLNQKRDILPVANGVLELHTATLRPYEREDYLTHKLSVPYNPDADTSKQDKFFRDVLRAQQDEIEYIHYFLGYCLTGEITLQKILVLEGSLDGANGKSVLLDCLASVLGSYLATINRKAFVESKSANNDSLYDAEFSRVACISEMNKNSDIDEGLLKTITGNDTFNVSAKYKNAKTFVPQWKVVMPLNAMFTVPADSGALWRRFLIMPFAVRFLSRDHHDWEADEFKAGKIIEKDDDFVRELKSDREGWLAWLVKGAVSYYAAPTREPPASLQRHLVQKQAENDAHLRFVEDQYVQTGNISDSVPCPDVVRAYRQTHDDETLREHERRLQNETKEATEKRIAAAMKRLKIKRSENPMSHEGQKVRCWLGLRRKTAED